MPSAPLRSPECLETEGERGSHASGPFLQQRRFMPPFRDRPSLPVPARSVSPSEGEHSGHWCLTKVEALAIAEDGTMWVSIDNDGVEDHSSKAMSHRNHAVTHRFTALMRPTAVCARGSFICSKLWRSVNLGASSARKCCVSKSRACIRPVCPAMCEFGCRRNSLAQRMSGSTGRIAALQTHDERREWAECVAREAAPTPSRWFLPGPVCMRGGAARHFASGRHFHRGIQAEATCRTILGKATQYQRLAESRPWRAGFFCGIQGIQFVEATTPEASQRKPACHAPSKWRFHPRREDIPAAPDRGFTGPLAATPRQRRTPRVERARGQRRRPMALGGERDCLGR